MLSYKQLGGILLLAFFWSPFFLLTKIVVIYFPPFTAGLVRCAISAILLMGYVLIRRVDLKPYLALWKEFVILGSVGVAIPFTLLSFGEVHGESGMAGIIDGLSPALTVAFSVLLIKGRRFRLHEILGMALGFIGLCFIVWPALQTPTFQDNLDAIFMFGAALFWAFSFVYAEITVKGLSPLTTTAIQQLVATLSLLPATLYFDGIPRLQHIPWQGWLAVFSLSSFIMASSICYYYLLRTTPAAYLGLTAYIQPPLAIVLGAIFLQEMLPLSVYIGCIIVIASMFLIKGRQERAGHD